MATPYKFWRVKFFYSNSGSASNHNVWLDELVFRDATGTDLCTGGTLFSSGDYAGGKYPASQAFDKTNATNGWSSQQGQWPCWLGYEFSSPVDVRSVDVVVANSVSADDELPMPLGMVLEYSSDGINYNQLIVGSWSSYVPAVGATLTFTPSFLEFGGALVGAALVAAPVGRTPVDFSQVKAATVVPPAVASVAQAQGPGRIAGTLKILTAPAARTVRLHDRRTGQLLRTTTSAPDGSYAFEGLQLGRPYLVVGLDDMGNPAMYNAAVADMVEAAA